MSLESATADALLGEHHPLVGALRSAQTAIDQLLVLAVVEASGAGLLAGGDPLGLVVILAAGAVQLTTALRLIVLRERVHDESLELIIEGHGTLKLATVERERCRLADISNRASLADSIERIAAAATSAIAGAAVPHLDLELVRDLEPSFVRSRCSCGPKRRMSLAGAIPSAREARSGCVRNLHDPGRASAYGRRCRRRRDRACLRLTCGVSRSARGGLCG